MRQRAGALVLVALMATVGLTACGDDDDDAASAELVAFCDGAVQGEAFFSVIEEDPSEDNVATMTGYLDAIDANAPDEIADESATVTGAVRGAMTGDFSGVESPEFAEAESTWDGYVFENCATGDTVELSAVDYGYEGVPTDVDAGRVGFRMANDGDEAHEMALISIADGEERSIMEIFEANDESAATFVSSAATDPGGGAEMTVDLEPGRYALICFIPTGTPALADADWESEAPPHAVQGMHVEFEVQ